MANTREEYDAAFDALGPCAGLDPNPVRFTVDVTALKEYAKKQGKK